MMTKNASLVPLLLLVLVASGSLVESDAADRQPGDRQAPPAAVEPFSEHGQIPGNYTVIGTVTEIRSEQIKADIGTPQPLFLPLRPAKDKGFIVKEGDRLEITLNDHNAIVDYHPVAQQEQAHRIIEGALAQALTVGHDTAVIRTETGEERVPIASRARSKLSTIPIGVPVVFLMDETGQIVDAQFTSREAVQQSEQGEKPPIKGAHRRIEGYFVDRPQEDQIKIRLNDGRERIFEVHLPLEKLARLSREDLVILMTDERESVIEIATPDVPAR